MLWLISYEETAPKTGHKVLPTRKVISADSSPEAMQKFLAQTTAPTLFSLRCEYVNGKVIE